MMLRCCHPVSFFTLHSLLTFCLCGVCGGIYRTCVTCDKDIVPHLHHTEFSFSKCAYLTLRNEVDLQLYKEPISVDIKNSSQTEAKWLIKAQFSCHNHELSLFPPSCP